MIKSLIYRPIAVLTITFGLIVLALFVGRQVPVSLLPDIPIPRLSIAISAPNKTARIVENTITRPLRNQLLQLNNLEDIRSSSRNGSAFIELILKTGSNSDLAFIETNEKVDQAMNVLPRNTDRPRVVKSNIADIPVFYLNLIPAEGQDTDILEISEFAEKVIKRRLEQQDEIAFADLHGIAYPEIVIMPHHEILRALNISETMIADAVEANNIDIGNVILKDGQYQFNVEIGNRLASLEDIKSTFININKRTYLLQQLADVKLRTKERRSAYRFNDRSGVILSVRKKSEANNFVLQEKMKILLEDFEKSYPQLDFHLVDDQSSILEISYQNLRTSLLYGIFFSCIILFLFFREWRLPVLIIITVPISLILTMLGFYLLGLSINIISLSGIILGVGLMIDNSIIIIDNIRQEHASKNLDQAITDGTADVVKPLISSALTTCSVFLPLILISGIAGVLFYDQAISISLALLSSLLVSILYLPVMARLIMKKNHRPVTHGLLHKIHHGYLNFVMDWKWIFILLFVLSTLSGLWFLHKMERKSFPELSIEALEIEIDWNANISIDENEKRIDDLNKSFADRIENVSAIIGEKQFLLLDKESGINEAALFVLIRKGVAPLTLIGEMKKYFVLHFPEAVVGINPAKNTFDYLFENNEAPFIAFIQPANQVELPDPQKMDEITEFLSAIDPSYEAPPTDEFLVLTIREDLLANFGVESREITSKLKTIFSANEISLLRQTDRFIPIVLGSDEGTEFKQVLEQEFIQNKNGDYVPLSPFIDLSRSSYYKAIAGTMAGESLIASFSSYSEEIMDEVKSRLVDGGEYFVSFGGQHFKTQALIRQLTNILLVVFLLLFLILAAQFESFVQPIIVLIDVPLSMVGSLLFLYLGNASLNMVSMVGLIIMAGIIVNDAILKVDMINKNRKQGLPLPEAISEGSIRRFRPIVMTSLTTILAFTPVLFSGGIGAEIQRPLALAVIGGLVIGTISSLVFLPVLYWAGAMLTNGRFPHADSSLKS